ncbi:hypothetical protein ACHAXA_005313, partial [Cyclostephanos tholiformis]
GGGAALRCSTAFVVRGGSMLDRDEDADLADHESVDGGGRGMISLAESTDEGVEDEEDEEDGEDHVEEDEDEGEGAAQMPPSSSSSSGVVRVTVRTSVRSPVLDRSAKMMSSGKRTILSLRQAEILEAYYLNVAGMVYGQELQMREQQQQLPLSGASVAYGDANARGGDEGENRSLDLRRRATVVRRQLEGSMSDETRRLIEEEHERVIARRKRRDDASSNVDDDDDGEEVFGLIPRGVSSFSSNLVRARSIKKRGGASMNLKRALQRNLNVVRGDNVVILLFASRPLPEENILSNNIELSFARVNAFYNTLIISNVGVLLPSRASVLRQRLKNWADTTRNSLLFLFFGYFGGRNSFSRTLLLLSSPLCFVIQTRPVKVAVKQLFYSIGQPPGIFLSLLPAPQQAIMSCDYAALMRGLYGEDALEGEKWLEMERWRIIIQVTSAFVVHVASGDGRRSRAYPLGCLHRHPSYYTYDERERLDDPDEGADGGGGGGDGGGDGLGGVGTTIAPPTPATEMEDLPHRPTMTYASATPSHRDFRRLPSRSSGMRLPYERFEPTRKLGSGKFSEVYEAVDVIRLEGGMKEEEERRRRRRRRKRRRGKRIGSDGWESPTSSSSERMRRLRRKRRRRRRRRGGDDGTTNGDDVGSDDGIVLPNSMDDENNDRDHDLGEEGGRRIEKEYDAALNITTDNDELSLSQRKVAVTALLGQRKQLQRVDDAQSLSLTRTTMIGEKSATVRKFGDDGHRDNARERDRLRHLGTTREQLTQRWRTRQPIALVLEHAGTESQWLCHDGRRRRRGRGFDRENDDNRDVDGNNNLASEEDDDYLSEREVKYYLCHLLVALDALHAAGIMHRDVKPRNTLINRFPSNGEMNNNDRCLRRDEDSDVDHGVLSPPSPPPPLPLMLVDLGLADFYHPGKSYNVRVASRHYKSPELLIGYEEYDYSVDMWAVGCILVGLLFRREPFFHGRDNEDQLGQIVSVLGIRDFLRYYRRVGRLRSSRQRADNDGGVENGNGMRLSDKARAAIGKYCSWAPASVSSSSSSKYSSEEDETPSSSTPNNSDMGYRKPWLSFLSPRCPVPSPQGLDLLDKLLVYDHELRWTAREALEHEFFDDVRSQVFREVRQRMEWEENRCQS